MNYCHKCKCELSVTDPRKTLCTTSLSVKRADAARDRDRFRRQMAAQEQEPQE